MASLSMAAAGVAWLGFLGTLPALLPAQALVDRSQG